MPSFSYPPVLPMAVLRSTYLGRHRLPDDGYLHNLNEISKKFYIHTDAECQYTPGEGLVSGNAKGNKGTYKRGCRRQQEQKSKAK